MAKKKTNRKTNVAKVQKSKSIDINVYVDKYFWLIIPILTIIYFVSSRYSQGFYQDDEIAQYINMLKFWSDPAVILGNNPKPGYKIFMVLPALFSYDTVLIVNSLIASLTVYFTYVMIKAYNINYAFFGAVLLAFQPLFFDLSFRSYSEIFTALCIVIFLILYKKEMFFWSALVIGYVFTVRQEIALVIIVLAILFIRNKHYTAIIGLVVFPVLYNLLGFLKTGDILYVMSEMQKVAGLDYKSQGLFHYFKVYIFIVGPISLALFLLGFFGFFKDTNKFKEYVSRYLLFYIIFIGIFGVQMMTMINDGPNPGNWRYLLHISPVCAFFATVGLNNLADKEFKKTHYIITGIFAFLILAFLSKTTDGFVLLDKTDYSKFIFILLFIVFTVLFWSESSKADLNKLSFLLIALAVISLYYSFEPKQLSAENISVKQVADYVNTIDGIGNREVLTNHTLMIFYSDSYKKNPGRFKSINSNTIKDLPKGSLIVWESHYGYRPDWGSDVQAETLQKDSTFKMINQFISSNRAFAAYVFEKVN